MRESASITIRFRSANACAHQAHRALALPELSEHDQAVARGAAGKGNGKLNSRASFNARSKKKQPDRTQLKDSPRSLHLCLRSGCSLIFVRHFERTTDLLAEVMHADFSTIKNGLYRVKNRTKKIFALFPTKSGAEKWRDLITCCLFPDIREHSTRVVPATRALPRENIANLTNQSDRAVAKFGIRHREIDHQVAANFASRIIAHVERMVEHELGRSAGFQTVEPVTSSGPVGKSISTSHFRRGDVRDCTKEEENVGWSSAIFWSGGWRARNRPAER